MTEQNIVDLPPQKRKRGRPPKAKQQHLPIEGPGVSPKRIASVERLADIYMEERGNHAAATRDLTDAKKKLVDAIKNNVDTIGKDGEGIIRYEFEGGTKSRRVIILKPTSEQLQVKDVEAFEEVDVI